jgi:hypothetical protein
MAARRIIEAVGKFVTVFWDTYGHFANGWDTHSNPYPRLKQFLLPVFDHSFPAFLLDLESQGLLDETLFLCLSEHGRTPQLNNRPGNGREDWSRVYSVALAGAGIGRGQVVEQERSNGWRSEIESDFSQGHLGLGLPSPGNSPGNDRSRSVKTSRANSRRWKCTPRIVRLTSGRDS